ncbi:alpha/beta hydrolase [Azospirillum picis]|uniref:Alpha-beta hydrolase superfamily lysophospholipase n=1 Tax=Azospirillum picis TaxID=488438 RepID=A0ABU0MRL1_9PROT|nr:alpha/beta hydrolase [Azospirillum picis]MBP2302482.1 alpha-beta hydrolase superfamily lysophospholipase [Azospirillum picis]MDQ0536061.1 alpha-beta hydrolase superfamily lysophospholipase [Azospirillum picis]
MGTAVVQPRMTERTLIAADGFELPLRSWLPQDGRVRAVVVALHGFNDYSNAFDGAGRDFAANGIATYAYDQRGFGATRERGVWAGTATLVADARTAVETAHRRHPGVPVYLMGESMGGAVVLTAMAGENPPDVAGTILVAPAVWGRQAMGFFPRAALWITYNLVPGMVVHPPRDLDIHPSDNIEMLRALGRDPMVIKGSRVDALEGLTELMGAALDACPHLRVPSMVLYGAHEEVLPPRPVERALQDFEAGGRHVVAVYPDGYHMLLRDLKGKLVVDDIVAWIGNPKQPLASGADRAPRALLAAK